MYVIFDRIPNYMEGLMHVGHPYEMLNDEKRPYNPIRDRRFYVDLSPMLMGPWVERENGNKEWAWVEFLEVSDIPEPTEEDLRSLI